MRAIAVSLFALLALAGPALAQVNVEDISPDADKYFWCGAAFGVLMYTQKDDADAAQSAKDNMNALFSVIAVTMKAKGLAKADYDAMVQDYTAQVMDPFLKADKSYSRDECDTAAANALTAVSAQ